MKWYVVSLIALCLAGIVTGVVLLGVYWQDLFAAATGQGDQTAAAAALTVKVAANPAAARRLVGGTLDRSDLRLDKLEYRIYSIQMAETIEFLPNSTGWTNPRGVLSLYQNTDVDQATYEAFDYDAAVADTAHYVDVLDPAAVAAQFQWTLPIDTFDTGGTYRFLTVNWFQPVKFQATALDGGGLPLLYTKTGTGHTQATTGSDEYKGWVTTTPTMGAAPAELATVRLNNGGSLFRLQTPLTRAQIEATPHTLYLLTDPYQALRAEAAFPAGTPSLDPNHNLQDPDGLWFNLGILPLTPVLVPEGSAVLRERYRVAQDPTEVGWDYLVQLYLVDGAIRAADVGVVHAVGAAELPATAPLGAATVFAVTTADDGSLSLDGAGDPAQPILRGLVRGSAAATCDVYDMSTATWSEELATTRLAVETLDLDA